MKCKGRAFIHEDKLQVTTVHSCSSREADFEVLLAKSTMKKKVEATSEDLRSIFQNTVSESCSCV